MDAEMIEQVHEVVRPRSISQAKVKNTKKAAAAAKMCAYYKDMECRLPVCDMKICEKCPEGNVYCTRVLFIKRMVEKILLFIVCTLFAIDLI